MSHIFRLLLSLPNEYNIYFIGSQISNRMFSTTILASVLSSLAGVLVKWWGANRPFYPLLGFILAFFMVTFTTLKALERERGVDRVKGCRNGEEAYGIVSVTLTDLVISIEDNCSYVF